MGGKNGYSIAVIEAILRLVMNTTLCKDSGLNTLTKRVLNGS